MTSDLRTLALVCSLKPFPAVAETTAKVAANAAHPARLLKTSQYPAAG